MEMKRFAMLLVVATLTLGSAWAKSYEINLFQPAVVAGTELKAGSYKLELNGTKMTLRNGRTTVECDVRVENAATKFERSSFRVQEVNGKYVVEEIRLRGVDTKLILTRPAGAAGSL
jgi:hypothetical protein